MTDPRVAEIKPQEPIELLPLPPAAVFDPGRFGIMYETSQMQAYARDNVRAALEKEHVEEASHHERVSPEEEALVEAAIKPQSDYVISGGHVVKPQSDVAELARRFHDTYERLAPSFGYETRADSKQFDPQSANGKLMIAVCAEITHPPITQSAEPYARIDPTTGNTIISWPIAQSVVPKE